MLGDGDCADVGVADAVGDRAREPHEEILAPCRDDVRRPTHEPGELPQIVSPVVPARLFEQARELEDIDVLRVTVGDVARFFLHGPTLVDLRESVPDDKYPPA